MSLPSPPIPLNNSCSAVYNNTLYTYSPNAFQSLPLTEGAQWEQLPMGISVTGGVCVQATPQDNSSPPALYIVGGNANSTQGSYQGFQRYVFADRKWESIVLPAPIMQNRLNHNAIYLNASSKILMYAGIQDGSNQYTSDTFTISTVPPYEVRSLDSAAPPAISPLLLTWSDSEAAMIGGTDMNTKVMVFSPSSHWTDSTSSLEYPLKGSSAVKGVVITGDDGSKILYTFDMTVSPNQVNRTILIDGQGNPVKNSKAISVRDLSETRDVVRSKTKRAHLTAAEWPAYNATLAPRTTRTEYSLAQDSNGLVVFSGGNKDDILCMFKARENCWANATALLGATQSQIVIDATSSSISTVSPTQTPLQSTPTPESVTATPSGFNYKLLGLVLGLVIGFPLLVLAVALCIRRRTKQKAFAEAGHQRRASGIPDEKDAMDFVDRGISFDTAARYQRHPRNGSETSFSSMAILMGKVTTNQSRPAVGRRNGSNASDSSSAFNKKYKNAISKPIPQVNHTPAESFMRAERPAVVGASDPIPTPRPRANATNKPGSIRRSSGWNRYWSGGSALNILGFGNKRTTYGSQQSDRESVYSEGGLPPRATQNSAMVQPLNMGHLPQGLVSQVPSGSPTIAHQAKGFSLEQGMAGQIERSHSVSSVSSYGDLRDAFASGVAVSIDEEKTWTPVGGHGWDANRVPSSVYTESNYAPTPSRTTMVEDTSLNFGPRFPNSSREKTPAGHSTDMSWLNLGNGDKA